MEQLQGTDILVQFEMITGAFSTVLNRAVTICSQCGLVQVLLYSKVDLTSAVIAGEGGGVALGGNFFALMCAEPRFSQFD